MVSAAWILTILLGVGWEAVSRHSGGRWTSMTAICWALWRRPLGRLALLGLWGFLGWHFFARYTLPA